MDIYLNELSTFEKIQIPGLAKHWMDEFLRRFIDLTKILKKPPFILSSIDFKQISFVDTFNFEKWLTTIDEDSRKLLLNAITKKPFVFGIPQYSLNDTECVGLGLAYQANSLTISYISNKLWLDCEIEIQESDFNDEEKAEIETNNVLVKNVSTQDCILSYKAWMETTQRELQNSKIESIASGRQFWKDKSKIFPQLIFSDISQDYILSLAKRDLEFTQILNRLQDINNKAANWKDGEFSKDELSGKPRPESDTRKSNFKDKLIVKCSDEEIIDFSFHVSYTPNAGRIYFSPNSANKKIYIGYIGLKLK